MEQYDPDRAPVYQDPVFPHYDGHGVSREERRTEQLSRIMINALCSYDALSHDAAKGHTELDYETWVDFDMVECFDVFESKPPNPRTGPTLRGPAGLKLTYDGNYITDVDDLDDACDLIIAASGVVVTLVDDHDPDMRRWVPRRLRGGGDPPPPPTEPPLNLIGRRRRTRSRV